MTKKVIAIIAALTLLVSLFATGCSSKVDDETLVLAYVISYDQSTERRQENTYNAEGLLEQEYIVAYKNGAVYKTTTNQYCYNEKGILEEKTEKSHTYGESEWESVIRYAYDEQGREIEAEWSDGRHYEYAYEEDEQGRVSKMTTTAYDGEEVSYIGTEVYTYHEDGNYTVERHTGTASVHQIFTKDAEDLLIYSWTEDSGISVDNKYEYEKTYDENGNWITRKVYSDGVLVVDETRAFDENGNMLHHICDALVDSESGVERVEGKYYVYLPLKDVMHK